ncbi:MAG TPA: cupin domain-containing protein [Candidatus Limnocylindrales bacterium]
MESLRPRAIGATQRTTAGGDSTPGMIREQAFAGGDRWVGVVHTEPGVQSGWHHHGETDTYFYVLAGALDLEFGPGGTDRLRAAAGDWVHVPHSVVHREVTPPDQPAELALVRFGSGAPVVNVEGPEVE